METPKEYDHLFKITIIGDSGVGKSSILLRFTDDNFDEGHPCTIGVDFKTQVMELSGKTINLSIWDTAGQEKFRSLTSSYYRGTQGIILVYDVTKRTSFSSIEHWLEEVENYATNADVIKLLVANKIDLPDREVSKEEGIRFARKKSMIYIETSAKTKMGIQQTFQELVQKILDTPTLWADEKKNVSKPTVSVSETTEEYQQPSCFC
eukprot:TRINITY_DN1066_c0_g4_i1.p1 TRINITY_DN1066_c0_g4~~TRINITY_DN1066_c0_g4_i1.p1  ORF type:complete len:219 (+),score=66.32 TRINITY_DN1066_c0_g4_i1:38-658(+)